MSLLSTLKIIQVGRHEVFATPLRISLSAVSESPRKIKMTHLAVIIRAISLARATGFHL